MGGTSTDQGGDRLDPANAVPLIPNLPNAYLPSHMLVDVRLANSLIVLRLYADRHGIYDVECLEPEALRLLQEAQAELKSLISRNVFLSEATVPDQSQVLALRLTHSRAAGNSREVESDYLDGLASMASAARDETRLSRLGNSAGPSTKAYG